MSKLTNTLILDCEDMVSLLKEITNYWHDAIVSLRRVDDRTHNVYRNGVQMAGYIVVKRQHRFRLEYLN